jgi:hypothetical protein
MLLLLAEQPDAILPSLPRVQQQIDHGPPDPLDTVARAVASEVPPKYERKPAFRGCRPWYRDWYERYLCLAATWESDADQQQNFEHWTSD